MDNEEKKESFAEKAKSQFDALRTQEGRDAIKNKAKERVEGVKKLWNATSVAQRVGILAVAILATVFLFRSCSPTPPAVAVVASNDTVQQEKKDAPKLDESVDLTKANDKTDSLRSFVGFEFGTSADKFKDVEETYVVNMNVPRILWTKEFKSAWDGEWRSMPEEKKDELALKKHHSKFYTAVVELKNKFRLFDFAVLKFTGKDKRLYKITIQTKAEVLAGYKPTSILREAQYCAAIIERKYGSQFSTHNSRLYEKCTEDKDSYYWKYDRWSDTAQILGSVEYATPFKGGDKLHKNEENYGIDSGYAIAPGAHYHGFFNNTIEIDISCGSIGGKYLGITISAMDHSIIEEEGGRTKFIPLDADDDEGKL